MAAKGSTKAVVTALAANLGIAVSKFVAAAITGSASMLAEGVHSVADSTNQALLLVGGKRARRAPSALHPFGYARERYI
ncbi:cation diffusion facilitator family transporter [Micromonospora thermarum]|uniref:cation diffusion facilitator family transporter n=1 Tax=Micromonospora thermarum TaxID=2720024 RepID=UPI002814D285|nr:cation transporter [Micromonospora thermarum]